MRQVCFTTDHKTKGVVKTNKVASEDYITTRLQASCVNENVRWNAKNENYSEKDYDDHTKNYTDHNNDYNDYNDYLNKKSRNHCIDQNNQQWINPKRAVLFKRAISATNRLNQR